MFTHSYAAAPSQWLSVMTAAQMGRRKNMEDETLVVLDINDAHALSAEQHGALSLIVRPPPPCADLL